MRYLTVPEAAAALGIGRTAVFLAIRRGSIAAEREGRAVLVCEDEVERYRRERRVQIRPDPIEDFWRRVDTSGGPDACWPWLGVLYADGYGQHRYYLPGVGERQSALAHRFAWEATNGPIRDGQMVCHTCDVRYPPGSISYRRCCNPSHAFLGSALDNNRDRHQKGRDGVPADLTARNTKISAALRDYFRANPRPRRQPVG